MIRTLTLQEYRGFDQFELSPLRRINIHGGANNTGKTALLEALALVMGYSIYQLPYLFRNRFDGNRKDEYQNTVIHGYWKLFFPNLDEGKTLSLSGRLLIFSTRSLPN